MQRRHSTALERHVTSSPSGQSDRTAAKMAAWWKRRCGRPTKAPSANLPSFTPPSICPVCHDALQEQTTASSAARDSVLTGCGHSFHRSCISAWRERHSHAQSFPCPCCRTPLDGTTFRLAPRVSLPTSADPSRGRATVTLTSEEEELMRSQWCEAFREIHREREAYREMRRARQAHRRSCPAVMVQVRPRRGPCARS